jgi:hypothetical protein
VPDSCLKKIVLLPYVVGESIEAFGGKCWEMKGLQVPITLKEGGGRWADGIRESYQKVVSDW